MTHFPNKFAADRNDAPALIDEHGMTSWAALNERTTVTQIA